MIGLSANNAGQSIVTKLLSACDVIVKFKIEGEQTLLGCYQYFCLI